MILEGFSLVLNDGDKAVIIGEEGNGKSPRMKWFCDLALTEGDAETKGTRVHGDERLGDLLQELPEKDRGKTFTILPGGRMFLEPDAEGDGGGMSDFYKTEGEKFCRVKESGAFMNCINCQP